MATSKWFDYSTYMNNKLAQMKEIDPSYTMTKLKTAFEKAGFVGDEGAQQHFAKYGQYEDVSPNQYFDAEYYYKAKALDYYTSEAGGSHAESEVRVNLAKYAQDVEGLIRAAGMNAWSHYIKYGTKEGINPSDGFNTEAYMEGKLKALQAQDPSWTADKMYEAFKDANLNALEHAMQYGGDPSGTKAGEVQTWADNAHTAFVDAIDSNDDNIGGSGAAFNLTTAIDTINGDTNATVTGVLDQKTNILDKSTFNNGDTINTAKDVDITIAKLQADTTVVAELNNVVNLNIKTIDNQSTTTFNAASYNNVQNILVAPSTVRADLVLENVDLASTVGINSSAVAADGTLSQVQLSYRATQVGGDSDVAKLSASDGKGAITINSNIEQIDFTGTGTNVITLTDNSNGDTIAKMAVAGAGTNTLNLAGLDNLKEIDLSASTGTNTANLGAQMVKGETITGGAGEDTVAVNGDGSVVKDLVMSGVETFSVATPGSGTYVFKSASDVATIKVSGSTAAVDVDNEYALDKIGSPKNINYVGTGKNDVDKDQYFASLSIDDAFTSSEDALAISVNNGGNALKSGIGYEIGELNLAKLESATIAIADDNAKSVTTFDKIDAADLTSLKVSSDAGSVTITEFDGGEKLATLDFSGVKGTDSASEITFGADAVFANKAVVTANDGGLKLTIAADETKAVTFNGGDGDDTFDMGAAATGKMTINGGDGDDTIATSAAGEAVVTGGAGADAIALNGDDDVLVYTDTGEGGKAVKATTANLEEGDEITAFVATNKINVNKLFTKNGAAVDAVGADELDTTTAANNSVFILDAAKGDDDATNFNADANGTLTAIGNVTMEKGDVAWVVQQLNTVGTWAIYEITAGSEHDGTDGLLASDTVSLLGTVEGAGVAAAAFDFAAL